MLYQLMSCSITRKLIWDFYQNQK